MTQFHFEPGCDLPGPVLDRLAWLGAAGVDAFVDRRAHDLAVLVGARRA
ncbi:MAG TPA: hypothetical protein VFH36_02095 [Acidimicrobiales bacterium]|nr:hypothetical protein [Acidimicrobiales bacterium]